MHFSDVELVHNFNLNKLQKSCKWDCPPPSVQKVLLGASLNCTKKKKRILVNVFLLSNIECLLPSCCLQKRHFRKCSVVISVKCYSYFYNLCVCVNIALNFTRTFKIVLRFEKRKWSCRDENQVGFKIYLDITWLLHFPFKTAIIYIFLLLCFGTVMTYACLLFLIFQK